MLLPLVGLLLGLLAPRSGAPIELGAGAYIASERGNESAPWFVASEYHDTLTTLWLVSADDPDRPRLRLADVPHASGWDIEASVAPQAGVVAVLAIPPGGWNPASHAALLLIDDSTTRPIAAGLDLRGGVVWSDDGRHLIVRRAGAISVVAGSGREVGSWSPVEVGSAHPIAMRGDTLWVALVRSDGTFVVNLTLGDDGLSSRGERWISNEATREWTLSPNGARLAFTEQRGVELSVRVAPLSERVDLWVSNHWTIGELKGATGQTQPAQIASSASPVWRPDGTLDVGRWTDTTEQFTLPVGRDPSGRWLALRSLAGSGPGDVTAERLVLRGPDDTLRETRDGIKFVGWWTA